MPEEEMYLMLPRKIPGEAPECSSPSMNNNSGYATTDISVTSRRPRRGGADQVLLHDRQTFSSTDRPYSHRPWRQVWDELQFGHTASSTRSMTILSASPGRP